MDIADSLTAEVTRLNGVARKFEEENARLREALLNLAFAIAPSADGSQPYWDDPSIESYYQEPMVIARNALSDSS